MTKEQEFYGALRDVFVGAKVEGESGYINLMRIKSRYYEKGVFPRLQEDINEALKPFPGFREELFEKLYDFFHRYFSESGSIYFRYTPLHQNIYEKVYTDDKDVMLFWKTHMLYYVKTDRLFKSMGVEVDGQKYFFDVSTLEHKKSNEKRNIVYAFKEKRKDTLVFTVSYSEKGKKTKSDEILKALRPNGEKISEDLLNRAFRVFEKQSEVDYFINKDAKAFLEEQFNLWLYQYVFSGMSKWTETRIKQLQTLKDTAFKIIAFISQFENELVKVWNKPKFVLNSNYVITLDRIAEKDIGIVEKLLAHKNCKQQIEEWQELGMVENSFKKSSVLDKDGKRKRLAKSYQHLPIDTKHFKDTELEILGLFDNLDSALDGWLIKSENYQALKTVLPKFREKVKCVYIDPPYNTGSDDFIYKDKFEHASWLTMMQNRLQIARDHLRPNGCIFVNIDDHEAANLKLLMDVVFSGENYIGTAVWKRTVSRPLSGGKILAAHDYVVAYQRTQAFEVNRLDVDDKEGYRNPDNDPRGPYKLQKFERTMAGARPTMTYKIKTPVGWITRTWSGPPETYERLLAEKRIVFSRSGLPQYKQFLEEMKGQLPSTWWKIAGAYNQNAAFELQELFGNITFDTAKPVGLVDRILKIASDRESIVMDFFAGSGPLAHAVIDLNRTGDYKIKYVMVEMADHFDTVLLPRIKKLSFSDTWEGGKAQQGKGIGHFIKYCTLEQYDDALRQSKYGEADLFDDPNMDPFHQYVFLRDLKMLEALEVDSKKNKVKVDLTKLYADIDIPETLSNLTGKWIKRITHDSVEFEDGEVVDTRNLDWKRIKPLIWW